MQITFNLIDLLLGLLVLVGVALGIFLIVFIARLIKTLTPLAQIATELSVLTKSANETMPAILEDAKAITGTARAGVEAVGSATGNIIGIVSQVLQIVGLFTHRDKAREHKPFSERSNKRRN